MKAGTKILLGNWLIVTLFILIIILGLINIREIINDSYKVMDNHIIIKNIIEMKTLITDLEAREREFLITGENDLIAPYKEKEDMLIKKVLETEELLKSKNNPEESDWLEKIRGLIQQRKEIAAKKIEIRNKIRILIDSEAENNVINDMEKESDNFIDTELVNFRKIMNTNEAVKSDYPVLVKKNIEIRLLLADMKNGVSRFLITGKPEHLIKYSEAKEKFSNQINEIESMLLKDNQEHLQYIRKIKELSDNWYETVASKTEIRKELDSLISKGPGREIMKEIYNEFETFIVYKENIFTEHRRDYIKGDSDLVRIIMSSVGITVIFSLIISLILARSVSKSLPKKSKVSRQQPSQQPSYIAGYEIKQGNEIYQIANAVNNSVGELTKIAVLLQEVSDSLKKRHQKWEVGE